MEKEANIKTRRDHFAAQVLYSAAAHTVRHVIEIKSMKNGDVCTESVNVVSNKDRQQSNRRILPLKEWERFSMLCNGQFSKDEFLEYACRTGAGLPFGAPHKNSFGLSPSSNELGMRYLRTKRRK